MANPPQLSEEQRKAALAKAAEARRLRAEIKDLLKMGSIDLEQLLRRADADDMVGRMKVLSVIESLPSVGKVKARRAMEDIGIAESRRLRGLGDTQRAKLLDQFG